MKLPSMSEWKKINKLVDEIYEMVCLENTHAGLHQEFTCPHCGRPVYMNMMFVDNICVSECGNCGRTVTLTIDTE